MAEADPVKGMIIGYLPDSIVADADHVDGAIIGYLIILRLKLILLMERPWSS